MASLHAVARLKWLVCGQYEGLIDDLFEIKNGVAALPGTVLSSAQETSRSSPTRCLARQGFRSLIRCCVCVCAGALPGRRLDGADGPQRQGSSPPPLS